MSGGICGAARHAETRRITVPSTGEDSEGITRL
jgi:hypothetical protein